MKEQVVFEKEEFNQFFLKLADNVWTDLQKGWGYKMISRETANEIGSKEELLGFLYGAWGKTIDEAKE